MSRPVPNQYESEAYACDMAGLWAKRTGDAHVVVPVATNAAVHPDRPDREYLVQPLAAWVAGCAVGNLPVCFTYCTG